MARDNCVFVGKGFNITGLSSAAIQGFVAISWPTLTVLDLRFSHIDAATIAHLEAASWPCLLELHLSFNGLTYGAFQQLCNFSSSGSSSGGGSSYNHSRSRCCWPELDTLDVSANNMCRASPSMPTQLPRLTRQNMGRMCHLKTLDLSQNNMTASALEHLTSMSWPCLEVLLLKHTYVDFDAAKRLVGGMWPRLEDLDVQGVAIGSAALQVLLETFLEPDFLCSGDSQTARHSSAGATG